MLDFASIDEALHERPVEMVSVSPETWDLLVRARVGGRLADDFAAAWANGQAFLAARDGLRGRRPAIIEWKGSHRAPGDEVAPVDLRVDHVFLISCKYLSRIVINASPAHLFERLLQGGHGLRSGDWYAAVAPDDYQELYESVRPFVLLSDLPASVLDLAVADRAALKAALTEWPNADAAAAYSQLAVTVAAASAERWRAALGSEAASERMLWRLLRMGSAPYFVLGSARTGPLRLRIATPWDWRQHYRLKRLDTTAQLGGQPRVEWRAQVEDRHSGELVEVVGHVEIRWSHGRFGAPPEAKVYLDVPHSRVPGYFPLE